MPNGRFSKLYTKRIRRHDRTWQHGHIRCPNCHSSHVVKEGTRCGHARPCKMCPLYLKGSCADFISTKETNIRLVCNECGHKWSIVSSW